MFDTLQPESAEELLDELARAARAKRSVEICGANTKRLMAGPITPAGLRLSTTRLNRILQYEPKDLTIGVEAGMKFADLSAELARNGQMIPLDGPYIEDATVGGMVAANVSGSRRRGYGTARDLVIGMKFATLDGKMVQSGGMVVKNVAGLDMGKLMIGSFGTLAAITTVNFKLAPIPAAAATLLWRFGDAKSAAEAAGAAMRSALNPVAVDVLNPALSAALGLSGYTLAAMYAGNDAVVERANRDAGDATGLRGDDERRFWSALGQTTPRHFEAWPEGGVGRVSTTLADCGAALESAGNSPALAHAGSGVVRAWFESGEAAADWAAGAARRGWKGVVEFSGERTKSRIALWPEAGGDLAIMKRVKNMFDPDGLLNSGRLYGLI